jgi:hypothetical protein
LISFLTGLSTSRVFDWLGAPRLRSVCRWLALADFTWLFVCAFRFFFPLSISDEVRTALSGGGLSLVLALVPFSKITKFDPLSLLSRRLRELLPSASAAQALVLLGLWAPLWYAYSLCDPLTLTPITNEGRVCNSADAPLRFVSKQQDFFAQQRLPLPPDKAGCLQFEKHEHVTIAIRKGHFIRQPRTLTLTFEVTHGSFQYVVADRETLEKATQLGNGKSLADEMETPTDASITLSNEAIEGWHDGQRLFAFSLWGTPDTVVTATLKGTVTLGLSTIKIPISGN